MWIHTERDDLQRFKHPQMDSIATFSDNNLAQVTQRDGEVLMQLDGFSKHKP